jgi:hypothetical protein
MKPHIAYSRALRTAISFEKEIDGTLSVSGQGFTNAICRSFKQFADEEPFVVIRKSGGQIEDYTHCIEDSGLVCADGKNGALNDLISQNRFSVSAANDGTVISKKFRSWMLIPVLAKKDAFLAIVLARAKGRFSDAEAKAAEMLGEYYTLAFRNIRAKNKKANALADETRHRLLLNTQANLNRDQEELPGLSRAVDYSAGAGSDFALYYRTGEDLALVCTGDITAGDTERQSGLIYLDTWFSILSRTSLDARGMLSKLNLDMIRRSVECYASIALIRYAPQNGKAEISGCGNVGVIHFCHETMSVKIFEFGPAAGIGKDAEINLHSIAVRSGDILCAFTDGFSGTRKRNGDLFGTSEIGELVRKNYYLSSTDLSAKILSAVAEKEEKGVNKDDRTLQILKIE